MACACVAWPVVRAWEVGKARRAAVVCGGARRTGGERSTSASYVGVYYVNLKDKGVSHGKWQARIHVDGRTKYLGCFTLEDDAAEAYDDARVAQGKSRVNFPSAQEKAQQDAVDAQLRANTKAARERQECGEPTSSFVGVDYVKYNDKGGKWRALIMVHGKLKHLGHFMLEDDAAKAYDDARVAHGRSRVNFPSAQEKAEQVGVEAQLCANEKAACERRERGEPMSSFVGVEYVKLKDKGGKWVAKIHVDGKHKHLGHFMLEDDAAKAYDDARVAQGKSRVNFPSAQEKAEQVGVDAQLCANEKAARERRERGEPTSSFVGVDYVKYNDKGGKWRAQIRVDGKYKYLGCFILEHDAAKAHDDARVAHGKSRVNFPGNK